MNLYTQCCLVLLFNKNHMTIFTFFDLKNRFKKNKVADVYKSMKLLPKSLNLQKYYHPCLFHNRMSNAAGPK